MLLFEKRLSVGEDVEKLESLCAAGGNVKWCSHSGGQQNKKFKKGLPYDAAIPLLGIYLNELKAGTQTDIFTHIYSNIIHNSQKLEATKVPLTNKRINKM